MTPPKTEQFRPPDVEADDREATDMRIDRHWVLDKRIPLPLLAGIGLQTGAFIWWVATFSAVITGRVDAQGDRIVNLEHTVTSLGPISERLVKMETKFDAVAESLTEIKALLRQVPTRQAP